MIFLSNFQFTSNLIKVSSKYDIFGFMNLVKSNRLERIQEENFMIILGVLSPIIIVLFFLPSVISSLRHLKNKETVIKVNISALIIFILLMIFNTPDRPELTFAALFILWANGLIYTLSSNEIDFDNKVNLNKENVSISQKIEELTNLEELKKKGTITDDEFNKFKELIMKG